MGDWPENDALTASVTSGSTTLSVADATIYAPNWIIQIDNETMQVRSASGTTVTVLRASRGSTAASHANGATILVRPHFTDMEYVDALNAGISATFPWLYYPIRDETISTTNSAYQYTVPNDASGSPIRFISRLQFLESGDLAYRDFKAWDILRGATPIIKLRRPLPIGTLRVYGFGPFPRLTGPTDNLNTNFPYNAEEALTYYACQYLLVSGEARRAREDTGARDDREQANRPGTSLQASNASLGRFQQTLLANAMPPMPKHTITAL